MSNLNEKRNQLIKSAVESLGKTTLLCKKYLDGDDLTTSLSQINNYIQQYCAQDIKYNNFTRAVNKTAHYYKNLEEASEISFEQTFKQFHDKENSKQTKNEIKRHEFMIQYQNIIDEELVMNEETNDEGLSQASFTPPVDPITKQAIRHPVRNKQCGHLYEKDTISELIRQKNTRCPYIGCPAMEYISNKCLVPDDALKKKIDNYFLEH